MQFLFMCHQIETNKMKINSHINTNLKQQSPETIELTGSTEDLLFYTFKFLYAP